MSEKKIYDINVERDRQEKKLTPKTLKDSLDMDTIEECLIIYLFKDGTLDIATTDGIMVSTGIGYLEMAKDLLLDLTRNLEE